MITDAEIIELEKLLEEKEIEESREVFWKFCLYMDYEFFKEREEVLEGIAYDMQSLTDPLPWQKELDILNVSLPPRTGKSYLCTMFCAWCIGKRPDGSIMRNTVTAKLYYKFSGDLKSIILGESNRGRYNNVFPKIEMATSSLEGWRVTLSKQGITYFGAGIEGSIIGFGASMLSVLDDSIKDEFDALNQNSLDKKWGWYGSAADSREEKTCKKLFIGTRWSKKDIVGRLKALGYFNKPNAKEVVIPAIVNGKSYCETIHTSEKLARTKNITSRIIWLAEWMQEPIEAEGLLFPSTELKYFKKSFLEGKEPDGIISWCDVADEGTDYLSDPVGYIFGDKLYIADVVFTQDKIEISKGKVVSLMVNNNCNIAYFESNFGGKGYAQDIARLIKEVGGTTSVKWKANMQNKATRILIGSEFIKNNFYFLDETEYNEGSDYYEFMKQFTSYTHLGKNEHEDSCDSLEGLSVLFKSITKKSKKVKKTERTGLI